jgi:hypothetical protein
MLRLLARSSSPSATAPRLKHGSAQELASLLVERETGSWDRLALGAG